MAKATCQICKVKDDTSNMIKEVNKKYYHNGECHDKYNEQVDFRKVEFQKWCDLYEYLKVLHGVPDIPPRNIRRLKDDLYTDKGYGYDLLLEAYRHCEDNLKWFISDVLKGECDSSAIDACMTVMLNKGLNPAWQNRVKREKQQEQIQKQLEMKSDENKEVKITKINTGNKSDDMDITAFL